MLAEELVLSIRKEMHNIQLLKDIEVKLIYTKEFMQILVIYVLAIVHVTVHRTTCLSIMYPTHTALSFTAYCRLSFADFPYTIEVDND